MIDNKKIPARPERGISDAIPRTPVSHIPRNIAVRALTTSPRMSGTSQRTFRRALGKVIELDKAEPKTEREKFVEKISGVSIRQLSRRMTQAGSRRRRAERMLDRVRQKTPGNSVLIGLLESQIALQKYRQGWVAQEADLRTIGFLTESNYE